MQSSDGGWAAFDAGQQLEVLSNVPFADHNAMLDPTCPDITGRVLEALAAHGCTAESSRGAPRRGHGWSSTSSRTAVGMAGGAWLTFTALCFALRGLGGCRARDDREAHILRAGEWLRSVQNADGGWGESCAQLRQPDLYRRARARLHKRRGPSWAWSPAAIPTSLSVQHGIEYLAAKPSGSDGSLG